MADVFRKGMEHLSTPWLFIWAAACTLYAIYSALPYLKCWAYYGLKGFFDSTGKSAGYKEEAERWKRQYRKRIKWLFLLMISFAGYVFWLGLK